MEDTFNSNCKVVSHIDLGWTEDEYNDFMIDCFSEMMKEKTLPEEVVFSAVTKNPITITITSKDYYNPSK